MDTTVWPFDDLVVTTPRLTLRPVRPDDIDALGEAAMDIVDDDEPNPLMVPWFRDKDLTEQRRGLAQWMWRGRGALTADDWGLGLVVRFDGRPVGVQGLLASTFGIRREVHTGSWLTRSVRGQGIGSEMRRAVLHLAFAGLEAHWATSAAFSFNEASIRVSRSVGYEPDGFEIRERDGERLEVPRFRMSRARWQEVSTGWPAITVAGVEPCRGLLDSAVGA